MGLTPANGEIKAMYLMPEDMRLAASLLYQAYHDDPLFMSIFNANEIDYEKRLRIAIREELNTFCADQQPIVGLFSGEHLLGVACLIEPDAGFGAERFWHWRLKMLLTAGVVSTRQMIEKEKRIKDALNYDNYHLLAFIAVHPQHQHHGLGHYLMRAVDNVVDQHKDTQGIGVLVTIESNKRFFNDDMYQEVDTLTIGDVQGTLMFREKQR
ncbi:GNAT family N-acetyltransferase [Flocculibacter collagenilyticus]|uniref:GNAT family N-acetyltransferase n=1 Tax=Flocculibacter collagenilyticus TaxID=2744479 RepID=UPI0018F6E915|nr:GNAT family N-acetyltransferase [Flocculibacter collagenilyticus]